VLGRSAHEDPAKDLGRVISEALRQRRNDLTVAVSLCGAAGDSQGVDAQMRRLVDAGAVVTRNSAQAARIAVAAVGGGGD
jgi:FdrA protein